MRTSYVQDPKTGKLVLAAEYYAEKARVHFVQGELPDYQSPIDDRIVCGRRQRRYDLERTGCRPYEGREAEDKHHARQRGYDEQRSDALLDARARTAYHQMSPAQRRVLERGY